MTFKTLQKRCKDMYGTLLNEIPGGYHLHIPNESFSYSIGDWATKEDLFWWIQECILDSRKKSGQPIVEE